MKLRFTYHAQSQALARHIHESRVADTIRTPDEVSEAKDGASAYTRVFGTKKLRVIARQINVKGEGEYVILTAYYI